MIKVDKYTALDILSEMVEQVGTVAILEELSQQLDRDELCNIVSGLDDYLFDGHYTNLINKGEFD